MREFSDKTFILAGIAMFAAINALYCFSTWADPAEPFEWSMLLMLSWATIFSTAMTRGLMKWLIRIEKLAEQADLEIEEEVHRCLKENVPLNVNPAWTDERISAVVRCALTAKVDGASVKFTEG